MRSPAGASQLGEHALSVPVRIVTRQGRVFGGAGERFRAPAGSASVAPRLWAAPPRPDPSRRRSWPRSRHGAGVAQLVEHVTRNDGVTGSIPVTSSIPSRGGAASFTRSASLRGAGLSRRMCGNRGQN